MLIILEKRNVNLRFYQELKTNILNISPFYIHYYIVYGRIYICPQLDQSS